MDVHTPKTPIRSVREFLIEMVTITVGVLIALSFEGLREWNHNRTLANQARANIVRELTANKNAVDRDIQAVPKRRKNLENVLQFTDDILKTGKTTVSGLELGFNYGDLSVAGWQTAEHTGALGHMPYEEVQRFAAAYVLQNMYQEQERRSIADVSTATAAVVAGDPAKAPRADIEHFRSTLLTMSADLLIEEQLARQLSDRYAKVLKEQLQ
jgi:uncharacterized protein (UPF0297 family)